MMSNATQPVEIIPGHRESHSGVARKPFRLPAGITFAFSPESCSSSLRNTLRVHPGILFVLPRNPPMDHQSELCDDVWFECGCIE